MTFHCCSPLYSQILMRFAFALRYRRSLMPLDPFKCYPSVATSALKRPYANQATASAPRHYAADVIHPRSPSPPRSSERRPAKVPKLTGDYPSVTAMSASSRGTQPVPNVSPTFEMPSSSKSRGSLASRISGSTSQKNSSKRGKGRGKGKGKEQPSKATFPVLDGPLRDASFIEQQHRQNFGARTDVKPGLVDNPKSPVANFASHHLDKQPTYKTVEGFVSGTSERVFRSATSLICYLACAHTVVMQGDRHPRHDTAGAWYWRSQSQERRRKAFSSFSSLSAP